MNKSNYDKTQDDFLGRVKEATSTKATEQTVQKGFGSLASAGREEPDYNTSSEGSSIPKKTKIRYERININRDKFPFLADKEIGDKCLVLVEVRKISEAIPGFYETDKDPKISIEILNIAEPKDKA